MQLLNGTGHEIVFQLENGRTLVMPPDMPKVRVKYKHVDLGLVDGVKFTTPVLTSSNVPPQREGVRVVVSKVIKRFYPERDDLVIVGETVMTENGIITYGIQEY